MKFYLTNGDLAAACKAIAGSLPKEKLSAWRFVRIEAAEKNVTFTACDGDIQIEKRVRATVDAPGAVLVDGRRFVAFAGSMPSGDVEISTPAVEKVAIASGEVRFTMIASGTEDWPSFVGPGAEGETALFLPDITLREMLRKTAWAMSTYATRKNLQCVHFEIADGKLTMAATNGKSLAMIEHEAYAQKNADVSLPAALVGVLLSLIGDGRGDARLAFDGRAIRVTCDDWSVTSRTLGSKYPNWRHVVPGEQPSACTVDRAAFLAEVGRAALSSPDTGCVTVGFGDHVVKFAAECELSRYKSEVEADVVGEGGKFDFDFRLIKAALGCLDSDYVTIHFTNAESSPVVFKAELPWLAVVMPLRRD